MDFSDFIKQLEDRSRDLAQRLQGLDQDRSAVRDEILRVSGSIRILRQLAEEDKERQIKLAETKDQVSKAKIESEREAATV